MGAAGPLSLTDRETEAQAAARATQPGGAVSRRARRGLKPRAGARRAQGHRAGGPREAGWVGIRRPPRARAPPLGGAHGAQAAAAAAAAAGGAGASAQPRPQPLPA